MLKENGYKESIISKIIKRIANNHSLSQLQQQKQARDIKEEDIRMSIKVLVKKYGLYSEIGSTFYTESTLHKILCILKIEKLQKITNSIVYVTDCSNCEASTSVNLNSL